MIDGIVQMIHVGDSTEIPTGCRHTVIAESVLELIEVQLGNDISVQDKQKYILLE